MSIGCLMITTNRPDRLEMTVGAMASVEKHGSHIPLKVLSIDLLPECQPGCEEILVSAAQQIGWKVVTGECTGQRAMVNNIYRGLCEFADGGNYLFYCEDHVVVQSIPTEPDLEEIRRKAGVEWVCYNTHVHQENLLNIPGFVERPGREGRLAFINDPANWIRTYGDQEFLVKDTPIQDEYYLNFPAAITHVSTFRNLLQHACNSYRGIGIEIGFTKAWFETGTAQHWRPAIYTQPGTMSMLPLPDFKGLHMRAGMRFRNNDPSMLHPSIVPHQTIPSDVKQQRSFF